MATLERVMQMKQQGLNDAQIAGSLRQEGISPKEINDALSQSKIKSALNSNPEAPGMEATPSNYPMEQSMGQAQSDYGLSQPSQPVFPSAPPQPQEYSGVETQDYVPSAETEGADPGQGYSADYAPDYQGGEQAYTEYQPKSGGVDIETINEICEQTVDEKTEKLKKEISSFTKFREETSFEVQKMNERLTRMENNFNDLQMAILRKIGGYGEDIKNISREMHETQDSFSKILDPLTDNIRELQRITGKDSSREEVPQQEPEEKPEPPPRKPIRKEKNDFEDYLR
ncbi:Uncharacterised protein [uncultured archaeon]|nr:Uncharacterised protein [uncultured archaeon]